MTYLFVDLILGLVSIKKMNFVKPPPPPTLGFLQNFVLRYIEKFNVMQYFLFSKLKHKSFYKKDWVG